MMAFHILLILYWSPSIAIVSLTSSMSSSTTTAPPGHILEQVGLSAETLPRLAPIKNHALSRLLGRDSTYDFSGIQVVPRSYEKLVHIGESILGT